MNIGKVEKQIRKISNLIESIKEDEIVTSIEKDLLLSYVRSLYEKILGEPDGNIQVEPPVTVKETPMREVPTQRIEKVQPPKPVIAEIAREEMSEPVSMREEATAAVHKVVSPTAAAVSANGAEDTDVKVKENYSFDNNIPDSMKELFSESRVSELSDKLSHSPIKDLSKSMGINEKIFTIQELFGGDNELFNTTINRLNEAKNFNTASSYLANGVAKDQKWDDVSKQKKAITFIKLVQRRFA